MRPLVFDDTSIELSSQDDCFLTDISHLVLQVRSNGEAVDEVGLFSDESRPGVWEANEYLLICKDDAHTEISLSVSIGTDGAEHQLLGSVVLNGTELDNNAEEYEIPLIFHEIASNLVIKATRLDDIDTEMVLSDFDKQKAYGDAFAAYEEYKLYETLESLDQAIMQIKSAINVLDSHDSRFPGLSSILGLCMKYRFDRVGDVDDITDSVARYIAAVNFTPEDDSQRPSRLNNLAISLLNRFYRLGNIHDVDAAIIAYRSAANLIPDSDPDKPSCLSNLGCSLNNRFERLGDLEDIDSAITYQQRAVDLTPDSDPSKPMYLSNLGLSLESRFQRLGKIADIERAVASKQMAVDLTPDGHPNMPSCLSNLGASLGTRFTQLGNLADLNRSITSYQLAVDLTPDGNLSKSKYLNNLGLSLETLFEQGGNLSDLNKSVSLKQTAVDLIPDDHPSRPVYLMNLACSLQTRFERLGHLIDIDNAIIIHQKAIDLTPDDHPSKPSRLNNLGNSLSQRFKRLGSLTDINDSINLFQLAVDIIPNGHPDKPCLLSNLGSALQVRFLRLGNLADIDSAITSGQAAVDSTLDSNPSKPMYLNNTGIALIARFERLEDMADIDKAVTATRAAVDITPIGHVFKSMYLSNLGIALEARFNRFADLVDIDNAISSIEASLDLVPEGHPDGANRLRNLGRAFLKRYRYLGSDHDAESSIRNLSASATSPTGPPTVRFEAAKLWRSLASLTGHPSLLSACECAINILPLVAWLGLPIADRHRHLIEIGGITRDAVATAVSLGRHEKALEWLEHGRSIVWTQILQLRTPVDDLRDVKPELADRLVHISRLLDHDTEGSSFNEEGKQSLEEKGKQYRALTMERDSIIEQVRSLPNFKDFLRPPGSSQLMKIPQEGPLVVLNVAKERCDALALVPGLEDVVHIPLPNITSTRLTELGTQFKDMLYSTGVRMRGERAAMRFKDNDTDDDKTCKQVLAELWNGVVRPVLDSLAFSPHPDTLPRIWWCATGPLTFLPLHAAGIYDSHSVDSQLTDYAISSYIPTLSALLGQSTRAIKHPFKLLSVIQTSAPGASSIPSTKEELICLRRRLVSRDHVVLEGADGTKSRVMNGMKDCSWLHSACHGVQKPDEPTKSALILEDGHLTLDEIIRLNLPDAEFAFLSACQTTAGDEKLSEEAVHIAGGMLLAGYRGVVATMWSIRDDLAPEVADEFYAHIVQDDRPDGRKAAEALHLSVQKLREKRNVPLTSWIPFVHLGV